MSDETKEKKSPWRFAFLAAAVVGALELLGDGLAWLLCHFQGVSGGAASLGVIGGADGPTVMFVTYAQTPLLQLLFQVGLVVIGIWGYLRLKGSRKK